MSPPLASASRQFTRRDGLRALALLAPAAVLAACSGSDDAAPASSAAATAPPPVGTSEAADEAALVALYDATLAIVPESDARTRGVLEAVRDQHAAHRDALGGAADPSTAPVPPATLSAAIGALVDAERTASRARVRACVAATEPELARLLTFIAASEASHIPALRDLGA